ncbi:MAG: hypothetical protein ABIJ59_18155 [Pseudomonadota bacterium]
MVFFTSILIVVILYYLQADGLIYVTIIAVCGELINIFMTQTASKAAEKKTTGKFSKIIHTYKSQIDAQKKTIKELENIQEESVKKIMTANQKIKEYEEKLKLAQNQTSQEGQAPATQKEQAPATPEEQKEEQPPIKQKPSKDKSEALERYNDLPSGSNRKKLPF